MKTTIRRSQLAKRNKIALFFAALSLLCSFTLAFSFGPTQLSCNRNESDLADCRLTRFVMFGLVKQTESNALDVKSVEIEERQRQIVNEYGRRNIQTVYGLYLLGEKSVLIDGHSDNRSRFEAMADKINSFLEDDTVSDLSLRIENYTLYVMTILLLFASGSLFFVYRSSKVS